MSPDLISWIMCVWSLVTMVLMSEKRYRIAWSSSLLSQFGWAWCAWSSNLTGMFAFACVMVLVCLRALYRLQKPNENRT